MLKLSQIEGFDWDDANIEKNWLKHKVRAEESEQIFFNLPLLISSDTNHSQNEQRYHALGKTDKNRYLFISFTLRDKKIRIISARAMNKNERKTYEKTT